MNENAGQSTVIDKYLAISDDYVGLFIHMNLPRIAGVLLAVACLAISTELAWAVEDKSVFGTHEVKFEPIESKGTLRACTLVYKAVHADTVSKSGNPLLVTGSIGIFRDREIVFMVLKVGIKDLKSNDPIKAPTSAYLRTLKTTVTQRNPEYSSTQGGYLLISFPLDDSTENLVAEMIEKGSVTIGVAQKKGGPHLLAPLELTVDASVYTNDNKVKRSYSTTAMIQFSDCFVKLAAQAIESGSPQR